MPDTTNTPLLNGYKLAYVCRTFLQTFLGGIQLSLPFKPPCYVYLMQVFIWSLPAIIGGLASLIMGSISTKQYYVAVLCGFLFILLDCLIYAAVFFGKTQSREDSPVHNFLADEDEVVFTSLCSSKTLEFVIPPKTFYVNYFTHSVLSGILVFLGLTVLQPDHLQPIFENATGVYFIIIWGWFVICLSNYSLIGKTPKDVSTFYFDNFFGINAVTRAVYVVLLLSAIIIIRDCYSGIIYHLDVLLFLHVLFILYPILWIIGLLPRLDGFAVWLLEQFYIILLGGNQMASVRRLLVVTILSLVVVGVGWIIPSCLISLVVSTSSSVILSLDIYSILSYVCKAFRYKNLFGNPVKEIIDKTQISNPIVFSHILLVTLLVVSSGVVSALTFHFDLREKHPFYILTVILLVLTLFVKLLMNMQKCFWLGIFRNPMFSLFQDIDWIRKIHFSFTVIVIPLVLVLMSSIIANLAEGDCNALVYAFLMFRVHRMIWLDPIKCAFDFMVFSFIDWLEIAVWKNIEAYLQLFIVSISLKTADILLHKITFAISLVWLSFKQPEYQRKKVFIAFLFAVVLLPFTVTVFVLSSILSLPILPIFTLPFFFIAPPKLSCIWPNSCSKHHSTQTDWTFYEHLNTSLLDDLKNNIHLLDSLKPGKFYLIRFQDRLVFVSVLERGLLYSNIVMKGLELQETSCHTTEVQMIDDIIENTLNSQNLINKYSSSVINPRTFISFEAYSDAKNVLTGIIDNKEFTSLLSKLFLKLIVRNLFKFCHEKPSAAFKELYLDVEDSPINTQLTSLTPDDLDSSVVVTTSFGTRTINSGIQKKILSHLPEDHKTESTGSLDSSDMLNPYFQNKNEVNQNNDDDEFGNFGFDDSSSFDSEVSLHYSDNQENENKEKEALISLSLSLNNRIQPYILPLRWTKRIPFSERQLNDITKQFPYDWFQFVLKSYTEHFVEISSEQTLLQQYKMLASTCFNLLEVLPMNNDVSVKAKAVLVCQIFNGILPWSPNVAFLENEINLKELVLSAYRIAFKLAYDSIVYGYDYNGNEDLLKVIKQCDEAWIIRPEDDEVWVGGILNGTSNLLSMNHDKGKNVFKSRLLTKQIFNVPIFEVESECVLGLWSALAFELFYMTNDDDERYSIQALPGVFRNILIQCADPPLGYPIYSSGLQMLNLML